MPGLPVKYLKIKTLPQTRKTDCVCPSAQKAELPPLLPPSGPVPRSLSLRLSHTIVNSQSDCETTGGLPISK